MTRGRCPHTVWMGDDGLHGYPQGTPDQNHPTILVDHIMAGWKKTLDGPWRLQNGVDVTFGIGRDGSGSQYTSIFDAHWGNGVAGARWAGDRLGIDRYDRSNPRLAALEKQGTWTEGPGYVFLRGGGGSLVNMRSLSWEHEGFPQDVWTNAMVNKTIETKIWAIEDLARDGRPIVLGNDMLTGHFQIDGVNRVNCPGPNWPRTKIINSVLDAFKEDDMTPEEVRAIVRSMMVKDNPDFKNNVNHLIVERVAPVAKQADANARTIAAEAVEAHEASHGAVGHKHEATVTIKEAS